MLYGQAPVNLGIRSVRAKLQMMFYQDYPIKLAERSRDFMEDRLWIFRPIIATCLQDFKETFGRDRYFKSYVYISAKHLFQPAGSPYNRPGWHADGFMSDDINYIWSDKYPTIFNSSKFKLSQDDVLSMKEMEEQALPENDYTYPEGSLLRLNQYCIHRVNTDVPAGMRTFLKVSFSYDKYNREGNAHNYGLNYDWEMKPRGEHRNIPQSKPI